MTVNSAHLRNFSLGCFFFLALAPELPVLSASSAFSSPISIPLRIAVEEVELRDKKYEGKTIQEWISIWDAGDFRTSQRTIQTLAGLGDVAVPALIQLIKDHHRHLGYAAQTLAEMGPSAKEAIPLLVTVARNKSLKDPKDWTWNVPVRAIVIKSLAKMAWASESLLPLLRDVGNDEQETDQIRRMAIFALGGMGQKALLAVQDFARSESPQIRESAVHALVKIQQQAGQDKTLTLQQIIDQDPFDSNVPRYLADMKGIFNLGRIHQPTQRIKQLYRRELQSKPNPQTAWQLATIIRNGLANTDLTWAAPSDSSRARWMREDPDENYESLARALIVSFEHSEADSDLRQRAGVSLAKLRLLQGNWSEMNEWLRRVGEAPIPAELRPVLPPPPPEWKDLSQNWKACDDDLRAGNCGIEFRFVKRGRPLRGIPGVHVLVKERPKPQRQFFTGISVDTLLHATQPLVERPYDSFGYYANDRNRTRYGVSDRNGLVRIEGLPKIPLLVEILVPTANFAERGQTWTLMMETPEGSQLADRRDPRSVSADKPPATVELEEGKTIRYPIMFIRSQMTANVQDWDRVDENFVLSWDAPQQTSADHYNVKLTLSAPAQHPSVPTHTPEIVTHTQKVTERSWPVGKRGINKMRLVPGNIYLIEIETIVAGSVVASLPRRRVWVAWNHRDCDPPNTGSGSQGPPFYHGIYFRTSVNGKSLEERLPAAIRNSAGSFETEYNRLGMAWLDLHKKKVNAAENLRRLAAELTDGNVVRVTALSLLDNIKNGQAIPKRLQFVAPQELQTH